jgi:hypothetical protein
VRPCLETIDLSASQPPLTLTPSILIIVLAFYRLFIVVAFRDNFVSSCEHRLTALGAEPWLRLPSSPPLIPLTAANPHLQRGTIHDVSTDK